MNTNTLPISPELLEILRDPYAIQQNTEQGGDPGRLELVHNSWLVSPETGYKYPIRDGIPVMLIEEGRRWQETAVSDLPVPPPAPPAAVPSSAGTSDRVIAATPNTLITILAAVLTTLLVIALWRRMSKA
ncbi:MAG: hypothetical protein KDE56_06380 [Anaerolineales bacterium]|nr:hypothetical protein [Anaerolineales bacterium]